MQIYQLIGKILGVDPAKISEESNAQNTPKWDSLRHIEVVFAIENAFHVRFTMPEITGLRNVGDIRKLLVAKNVRINTPARRRCFGNFKQRTLKAGCGSSRDCPVIRCCDNSNHTARNAIGRGR